MDQNDTPSVPRGREGAPGSIKATLRLRDHGFEPKRDRKKIREVPSEESRERARWIYWLADQCGYDFASDDSEHDVQDVRPEHRIEVWRGMENKRKLKKKR